MIQRIGVFNLIAGTVVVLTLARVGTLVALSA